MIKKIIPFLFLVFLLISCDLLLIKGDGKGTPDGEITILNFSSNNDSGTIDYKIVNTGDGAITTTRFNIRLKVDITPTDKNDDNFKTVYKTIEITQTIDGGQTHYGSEPFSLNKVSAGDSQVILDNLAAEFISLKQFYPTTSSVGKIGITEISVQSTVDNTINFRCLIYNSNEDYAINRNPTHTHPAKDRVDAAFFFIVHDDKKTEYYFQKYYPGLNFGGIKPYEKYFNYTFDSMDKPYNEDTHNFGRSSILRKSGGTTNVSFDYKVTNNNAVKVEDFVVTFTATTTDNSTFREESCITLFAEENTTRSNSIGIMTKELKKLEMRVKLDPDNQKYEEVITANVDGSVLFK